jgi:hypothetical protein
MLNYDNRQKPIVQQRKFSIINKLLGYPDPRIDLGNSFLADVGTYLRFRIPLLQMDHQFYEAKKL